MKILNARFSPFLTARKGVPAGFVDLTDKPEFYKPTHLVDASTYRKPGGWVGERGLNHTIEA